MDPEFYRCEMLKVRVFFTHEETTEAKEGMSYLRLSVIRLELIYSSKFKETYNTVSFC